MKDLERTLNHGAVAASEQQRAIAEVQAAIMLAKANPRNEIRAFDRIANAFTRPKLAEVAVYAYARGGNSVSGPSIRTAETIAQYWGNMQFGIREISQQNGESTVQAFAWDVENNTKKEVIFQVPHVRDTKSGKKYLTDSRDIYELIANNGARRLRACILALIPGDIVDMAVEQAETTIKSTVDVTEEGIKKLLDTFEKIGVSKSQIEKRIQKRIDAINPAQVVSLRKIYASIKDAMSVPEDWFDPQEKAKSADDVIEHAEKQKSLQKKPEPEPDWESLLKNATDQEKLTEIIKDMPATEQDRMEDLINLKMDSFRKQ